MPDKRQESKQRRAARNRANREALAARRENAVANAAPAATSSDDASGAAKPRAARGRAGRAGSGAAGAPAATSPVPSASASGKRPGEIFLWIAFGLAIAGTLAMLFLIKAPVDDRGEPIPGGPNAFGGLTVAAREAVTGEPLPDDSVSYLDAYGTSAVISAALPLSLTAFALWASRRRVDRSRMLTYAMLGMAVAIFIGGGLFVFFPSLIFLAVGGFIARRADLPARVAERATGTGGGLFGRRGPVIDADSEEVGDSDETGADDGDDVAADQPAAAPARRKRRRGVLAAEADDTGAADVTDDDADVVDADVVDADVVDAKVIDAEVIDADVADGGDVATKDADDADVADAADVAEADEVDPLAELEAELEAERAEEAARGGRADETDDGGTRRKR